MTSHENPWGLRTRGHSIGVPGSEVREILDARIKALQGRRSDPSLTTDQRAALLSEIVILARRLDPRTPLGRDRYDADARARNITERGSE